MHRPLVLGAIVILATACGGTEGGAQDSANASGTTSAAEAATGELPTNTSESGASSTSSSTNASSSGTTGSSNDGAGGAATVVATVDTTSGGGVGTANASSGTDGGPVACGDVACGPPLRATVAYEGGLSKLSGAGIHICVDEWCASGTFPEFSVDGVSGYVADASFVTDAIDEATGRGGYFVEAYTDYDRVVISHESVVGERFSVEFTLGDSVLRRESGTLKVETTESTCLSCTTYTFLNLPE